MAVVHSSDVTFEMFSRVFMIFIDGFYVNVALLSINDKCFFTFGRNILTFYSMSHIMWMLLKCPSRRFIKNKCLIPVNGRICFESYFDLSIRYF